MATKAAVRAAPRDWEDVPVVLRVEEVAGLLRCDPSTVYSMVRAGELPHRRVGRVLRFDRDKLAAWLADSGESTDSPSS